MALRLVCARFCSAASARLRRSADTVKRFFRAHRRPTRQALLGALEADEDAPRAAPRLPARRAAFLLYGLYYPRSLVAEQVRLISLKAPKPQDRARARRLCREKHPPSATDLASLVRDMAWEDVAYVGW